MFSPGKITREEFDEALGRYPALIKRISTSKALKANQGQLTLEELDTYRFEVIPSRRLEDANAAPKPLSRADVVQLVRWKLKHGTFRPNLLKLVESNSEDEIKNATQEAFETYKKDRLNIKNAISKLIALKGIGPATASLILSVHDPATVVFFGDEVYQWICHESKKVPIKYTLKEYEELVSSSRNLMDRLEVDARDVEKVGFVLVSEGGDTEVNENRANAPVRAPKKKRKSEPVEPKQLTDMTEERKSQLVDMAAKGRAARVAKSRAKLVRGAKFRERLDAAKARKKDEPGASEAVVSTEGNSEIMTRGSAASTKRSRNDGA